MRLNYFLVPALLTCLFIFSLPLMANADNAAWQHQATTYYDSGDYDKAYKAYLKLSKQGDRFSAYRVSYMMLKGQGTKPNVIDSFAWAAVAAKNGSTELREYRDAVATLVPEKGVPRHNKESTISCAAGARKMRAPRPVAGATAPDHDCRLFAMAPHPPNSGSNGEMMYPKKL